MPNREPWITRVARAYLTARGFRVGLQLLGRGAPRAKIEQMYCGRCGHWRDAHVAEFCTKESSPAEDCPCTGFTPGH